MRNDGVQQVFVNNPVSNKESRCYNLDVLMANTISRANFDPMVIIYK